ncbi:MAG TPA: dephospho-CoA kinase [Bacteroidales bacterium]|jgi:dephospho-CoA kinase|nr:dephospho-CoA kinase [Bacteroidales bacterium]
MIKVGLTGGIGSGKTLAGEIFRHLGIAVFNADNEAKIILNNDQELKHQIENIFGEIYVNSEIDRKKLASIIFNDKEALKTINSLIHPKVRIQFHDWVKKQVHAKYIVEEAAILFESNAYKELDITINVHADELIRINRVVKRDNTTEENVKSRMKNQLSDSERIKLADHTIYNNGDRMLLPQILEIHHKILNMIK